MSLSSSVLMVIRIAQKITVSVVLNLFWITGELD